MSQRMGHFMNGDVHIIVTVTKSLQKIFPGKIDAAWCNMADIKFIYIFGLICIACHINVFEKRELIFFKSQSKLRSSRADQDRNFRLLNYAHVMKIFQASQEYEKTGQVVLSMLPDERERTLVSWALAREPVERYASCAAFVKALRDLLP